MRAFGANACRKRGTLCERVCESEDRKIVTFDGREIGRRETLGGVESMSLSHVFVSVGVGAPLASGCVPLFSLLLPDKEYGQEERANLHCIVVTRKWRAGNTRWRSLPEFE